MALLLFLVIGGATFVLLNLRQSNRWSVAPSALAAGPPQTAIQGVDPPGTIDGAKNPDLIPDNVAYKMLFLSLLEPADAKLAQPARQQAKLKMIGLSAGDQAGFLAVLNDFQKQMSDLGAQTAEILKATPNPERDSVEWLQLSDIEEQNNTLVTDTVEALNARLSPEGVAKLHARLLDFKHTIKAFPMPNTAVGQ